MNKRKKVVIDVYPFLILREEEGSD
jgi:hypothetical protein